MSNVLTRLHRRALLPGLLAGAAALASRALAQTGATNAAVFLDSAPTNGTYVLPTITIFATPQNPEPQSSASALTVLSGSQIGPGGINEVRDFPAVAPNLSVFDANNTRTPKFSVRGLRENNFTEGEPALGLYVDDIPYSDLYSRGLPLFGIEQVDFLRGPQGSLYGAGGPGGVINIYTRQPGNDFHGAGTVSYGSYNEQNYQAGVSGPIVTNNLYLGLDGVSSQRDGFVQNLFDGTHPDTRNTLSGRAQLRWTPNEMWDISLYAGAGRDNDGFVPTYSAATGDEGLFHVNRDFDGFVYTANVDENLKISFQNPEVKVTSVTSHRDWRQDLQQDFDFSALPEAIGFTDPRIHLLSEELRAQSPEGTAPLQWLGGFYFADQRLDSDSGSILPSGEAVPFPPFFVPGPLTSTTLAQFQNQSYALFGQGTYAVCDHFDVIGGLRLEYDDRTMRRQRNDDLLTALGAPQPANVDLDDHFEAVLPKVGVDYHLTSEQSIYANAAAGYQPGGFNASSDAPNLARYGGVNSWNFEAGWKSSWFGDKLTGRAAMFYSRFHGYQVYRFNLADPEEAYMVNAGRAHSYGAELELEAHPTKDWEFSAGLGWTEARFDDFTDPGNGLNFAGDNISFVPEYTALLAAQYNFMSHFYARAEMEGVGNDYLTDDNSARQSAYALLNARLGFQWKNLEASVYGRNLLDKQYANNALDFPAPTGLILQPGDPATFGGAITVRF